MKNKLIASSLAGLALLGGTVAFAVTDAGATTPTTSAPAATAKPATTPAQKGDHWLRNHRKALRRAGLVASAKVIGITPAALRADLKAGQTVAQVANAKGITTTTLVGDLSKDVDARVQKAVTNGKLTQDQATKIEAKVPAALTKAVNHQFGQH